MMMKPSSPEVADQKFEAIMHSLGLSHIEPGERIKALKNIPANKLVQLTPALTSLGAVIDQDTIPCAPFFATLGDDEKLPLPGRHWCKRLYMVDSQVDVRCCFLARRDQGVPGLTVLTTARDR